MNPRKRKIILDEDEIINIDDFEDENHRDEYNEDMIVDRDIGFGKTKEFFDKDIKSFNDRIQEYEQQFSELIDEREEFRIEFFKNYDLTNSELDQLVLFTTGANGKKKIEDKFFELVKLKINTKDLDEEYFKDIENIESMIECSSKKTLKNLDLNLDEVFYKSMIDSYELEILDFSIVKYSNEVRDFNFDNLDEDFYGIFAKYKPLLNKVKAKEKDLFAAKKQLRNREEDISRQRSTSYNY